MPVGADHPVTATREALLRARGYSEAAIAGNGNGRHPEGETPPPAPADDVDQVEAVDPPEPGPALCALDGCDEPLTGRRRRYCSEEHSAEGDAQGRARRHQRAAAKRTAAARASTPSPPPPSPEPSPDDRRRPGVAALVSELLGGAVAEVRVEVDGAVLVARGHR